MTQLVNGPISGETLMQRLASAKKVMSKVDSGDYTTGHINRDALETDDLSEGIMPQNIIPEQYQERVNTKPVGTPTIDKINQSKLPDAIKRAMIEKPIDQSVTGISLGETLDINFINGVKRLMEDEESISIVPPQQRQQKQQRQQPQSQNRQPLYESQPQTYVGSDNLIIALTPIIENIIRKTLDDIVDKKISQILNVQQTSSINENLVLKVGDSIFKGKITGVNKVTKK